MVKYIREMKMAGRYQFSEEEIKAIEQKRKGNKDKRGENSSGRRVMRDPIKIRVNDKL